MGQNLIRFLSALTDAVHSAEEIRSATLNLFDASLPKLPYVYTASAGFVFSAVVSPL